MLNTYKFQGPGWQHFIEVKLRFWTDFYRMWIEGRKHEEVLVIFYEDMKINLETNLENILTFLKIKVNQIRIDCVLENQNTAFQRKTTKSNEDWLKQFSMSQKLLIVKHVEMLNQILVKNGHRRLPGSDLDFYKI